MRAKTQTTAEMLTGLIDKWRCRAVLDDGFAGVTDTDLEEMAALAGALAAENAELDRLVAASRGAGYGCCCHPGSDDYADGGDFDVPPPRTADPDWDPEENRGGG